jgi:flagellar basal body-associated protein FliL
MNEKSKIVKIIIWALVALVLGAVAFYVVLSYMSF